MIKNRRKYLYYQYRILFKRKCQGFTISFLSTRVPTIFSRISSSCWM